MTAPRNPCGARSRPRAAAAGRRQRPKPVALLLAAALAALALAGALRAAATDPGGGVDAVATDGAPAQAPQGDASASSGGSGDGAPASPAGSGDVGAAPIGGASTRSARRGSTHPQSNLRAGEYIIFFKYGTRGIEEATKGVHDSVSATLTATAARAAGPASAADAALASQPFRILGFTDVEVAPDTLEPVPYASSLVKLHRRALRTPEATARVLELIKANPAVDFVVQNSNAVLFDKPSDPNPASAGGERRARQKRRAAEGAGPSDEARGEGGSDDAAPAGTPGGPRATKGGDAQQPAGARRSLLTLQKSTTTCGPFNRQVCDLTSNPGLCCSYDGTCGDDSDHCGDRCQISYGKCNMGIPRINLPSSNWGFYGTAPLNNMMSMSYIEAGFSLRRVDSTYPNGGPLTIKVPVDVSTNAGLTTASIDSNVTIAVIDSGIGPHHQLNIVGGYDCDPTTLPINRESQTYWRDAPAIGHGTHVAGIIGAKTGWNGPWGVMPGVKLFSLATFSLRGTFLSSATLYGVINAMRYVEANCLAKRFVVVNMSIGNNVSDSATQQTYCDIMRRTSEKCGTVWVTAAGNDANYVQSTLYPQNCQHAIVVTALATCSENLPLTTQFVTCSAYSETNFLKYDLITEMHTRTVTAIGGSATYGVSSTLPGDTVGKKWGTSMAAPQVAGVAARCFIARDCVLGDDTAGSGLTNLGKVINPTFARKNNAASTWWTPTSLFKPSDGVSQCDTVGGKQVCKYLGPLIFANHW